MILFLKAKISDGTAAITDNDRFSIILWYVLQGYINTSYKLSDEEEVCRGLLLFDAASYAQLQVNWTE